MTLNKRLLKICVGIFFGAEILFLLNIGSPLKLNFDEFHYIPAAKQFLTHQEMRNWEHPPLGKLLIAPGIALFGDNPFGWRVMSTVFGSLTLVALFLLGLVLFRKLETAFWVAALTLCNFLLYVQARIAMLDTFMFFFLSTAMLAFAVAWQPQIERKHLRNAFAVMGASLGLASACKWFGAVCWMGILALFLFIKIYPLYRKPPKKSRNKSSSTFDVGNWIDLRMFGGMPIREGLLWLVATPVTVYFLTFIPLFFIRTPLGELRSFWDLILMQKEMWAGQLRVVNKHPYMSHWWDWPFMTRPIWYAFDREGNASEFVRGVILLGNPLVMWSGVFAMALSVWLWIKKHDRTSFVIVFFYALFFGSWVVIPRKVSFYYYYYPAGMILSLALAQAFEWGEKGPIFQMRWARWMFLAASAILFVYFFPILSGFKIPWMEYLRWMWFRSWI